jgi:hypothetical protein
MPPLPDWLKRIFRAYIVTIVGILLLVGALFVLNIFVPLGKNLDRTGMSALVLLLAWGWGMFGAWIMQVTPLRPAGALGMITGLAGLLAFPVDIWRIGEGYQFQRIAWAFLAMQGLAAAGAAAWRALDRKEHIRLATLSLLFIAVGGALVFAAIVLPDDVLKASSQDHLAVSGLGLSLPMAAATLLLLLPLRPRLAVARNVAYAGFVELALFLACKPWVADTARLQRLHMAAVALAVILGLIAVSFFLLDVLGLRREPETA